MTKAAVLRIEPGGQPVESHAPDGLAHAGGASGMVRDLPVGDEEVAVVRVLQLEPSRDGARVVPEVQRAGGSDAGEDALAVVQRRRQKE